MVEELLLKFLGTTERTGYNDENKNKLIPIDLSSMMDRAYVRSMFKRKLLIQNPKEILLVNNLMEQTRINLETSFTAPINLNTINGRQKILDTISNWVFEEIKLGHMPQSLKLN